MSTRLISALIFIATLALFSWNTGQSQEDTTSGQAASKEELEQVKGALDGLSESFTEYRNYVDALRKIKITGYVQPQFRLAQIDNPYGSFYDSGNPFNNVGYFNGGAFPRYSKNVFQLRRARVKVNYDNVLTQFVIQFDVGQTGLGIKDAYLSLIEPWTQSVGFQMGVFDRPFGYEISFSSGSRESPERARVFQTLFPGERELGAKLFYAPQIGPLSFLRLDVGMFNGSGPTGLEFDNYKDVIGHLAAQFPFGETGAEIDLGVSGYFGNVRSGTSDVYSMGTLSDGNKAFTRSRDTSNFGRGYQRTYYGVDGQFYFDVPEVGGLILRGEYLVGKQPGLAGTSVSIANLVTNPLYLRGFTGWYIELVQNVGSANQVIVKYDVYDPNTEVKGSEMTNAGGFSGADLKVSTLGLGVIRHWDDNIKFVLYYEIVTNETVDKALVPGGGLSLASENIRDNILTFRVQYKF